MWGVVRKSVLRAVSALFLLVFLSGCDNVDVSVSEVPVASFSANPTVGTAALSVNFTDKSTGEIASWAWDFDGDGTTDSTEQNPQHTYENVGKYTVALMVNGPRGSDTETKIDYIAVKTTPPVASFEAAPTSGSAPLEVQFTDKSTGEITSWVWDFGNDVTTHSTQQNPKHTYETVGKYTVTLDVTGPGGSDKETKYSCIEVVVSSEIIGPETEVGDAMLLSTGQGVSVVEAGEWKSLDTAVGLPSNKVYVTAIDEQGHIWVGHDSGLSVLDGRQWTHYGEALFGYNGPSAIVFDADGSTWVGTYIGLYVLQDDEWHAHNVAELGLGEGVLVRDLAVDLDGHVWVATSGGVSKFDGSNWTSYDDSSGLASDSTNAIAVDADGGIWVVHEKGASIFDGSRWMNYGSSGADVKVDGLYSAEDVAVDTDGRMWMTTYSQGVCVFDGDNWKTYTRENSGLIGGHGRAIACDSHGRVWVGTDYELAVFDGNEWRTYTEATSGLVADGISDIVCKGTGPSSIPTTHGTGIGSASGSVTINGLAAIGVKVCICWDVYSIMYFGSTPCMGEVYQATTDAEGRFSTTGIPIGLYKYAIYVPDEHKWYVYGPFGIPEDVRIISGQNISLGNIAL